MRFIGWIMYLCGCILSMRMAKDSGKIINGLAIIIIAIGLALYFSTGGE